MDIEINFTDETSDQFKSDLYHFLKDHEDDNLQKIDWIEGKTKKGEMGQAPAAGISSIVANSQIAFVEFFKTLQVWLKMYDKDLILKNRFGDEITFRGRITEKSIMKLADKFIGGNSVSGKKVTNRKKPTHKTKITKTKPAAKVATKTTAKLKTTKKSVTPKKTATTNRKTIAKK